MAGRWGLVASAAALLLAAAAAPAATVTWPDGRQEPLERDREVTGPAVVAAADGKDVIRLRPGAVLRFLGEEEDGKGGRAESFFLKSGGADADAGFRTRIAAGAFWAFPEGPGKRSAFHLAAFPGQRTYARTAKGSGLLRLLVGTGADGNREVHLLGGQGALVAREQDGVRLATDLDNEGKEGSVRFFRPLAGGRLLDVYVPKATEAAVLPAGDRILVASGLSSWRRGRVVLRIPGEGDAASGGELGPGAAATIDPATGRFAAGTESASKAAAPLRLLPAAGAPAGGLVRIARGGALRILALRMEAGGKGPRARLVLRNDGDAVDAFEGEVAFLYPAAAGNLAPFLPVFAPVDGTAWKPGEERTLTVDSPVPGAREPLDVLLLSPAGLDLPAPAPGACLLGGRVRVAAVECDLLGEKPWISFTLENAAGAGGEGAPGELRWELRFLREGAAPEEGAPAGTVRLPGTAGEMTVLRIELPGPPGALAGARPVLTLSR